jgi:hypothetical protein
LAAGAVLERSNHCGQNQVPQHGFIYSGFVIQFVRKLMPAYGNRQARVRREIHKNFGKNKLKAIRK